MNEPRVPAAIESLIRAVAGGSGDEDRDRRASTFARGVAIGALVGAAIAGSTIWQRRQGHVAELSSGDEPAKPVEPTEPPRLPEPAEDA